MPASAMDGWSTKLPPDVHVLDPLTDTRWTDLLEHHPRASVFHSRGWLEALKRTYGYEPIVLTTSAHGPLENGLALCRVRTWLSRRLVSLPFSDHCDPLIDRPEDLEAVIEFLAGETERERWRSLELRPRHCEPPGLASGSRYCLHTLDLARPEGQIFGGFHASSTQRAIRRAEREGLSYEAGTSAQLLSAFYRLLRLNFDLITGFSIVPLQFFAICGLLLSAASALLVGYLALRRIFLGPEVEGVFTLFGITFFLIGILLFGIGLLGEYVGRIYQEVRDRPRYLIRGVLEQQDGSS